MQRPIQGWFTIGSRRITTGGITSPSEEQRLSKKSDSDDPDCQAG
jgi:hypothetical protein